MKKSELLKLLESVSNDYEVVVITSDISYTVIKHVTIGRVDQEEGCLGREVLKINLE